MRRAFLCTLVMGLALVGFGGQLKAQEKKQPDLMTRAKAVKGPFTLVIDVHIKAGKEKEFITAFAEVGPASRKEPGCVAYELNQDVDDPTQFVLYERWKSAEALQEHMKQAHTKKILTVMGELTSKPGNFRLLTPTEGR